MSAPLTTSMRVPLSATARQAAQVQAAAQASPARGLQVYLNGLAVWAVQRYLQWLAIASDRQQSDSAQSMNRALFDTADLLIPGSGRLDCRPLRAAETEMRLPLAVRDDCLGYVAVQFADSLQTVQLLGFLPAERVGDRETIPLQDLQPLEHLLERLSPAPELVPVQLQQWLTGAVEAGWQALGEILTPPTPGLAWRRAMVQRARVLTWEPALAFCLAVEPALDDRYDLRLQVLPLAIATDLPAALRVRVLAADGEVFRELAVTAGDRWLQYEFNAQAGEAFAIEVQASERYERFEFVL